MMMQWKLLCQGYSKNNSYCVAKREWKIDKKKLKCSLNLFLAIISFLRNQPWMTALRAQKKIKIKQDKVRVQESQIIKNQHNYSEE